MLINTAKTWLLVSDRSGVQTLVVCAEEGGLHATTADRLYTPFMGNYHPSDTRCSTHQYITQHVSMSAYQLVYWLTHQPPTLPYAIRYTGTDNQAPHNSSFPWNDSESLKMSAHLLATPTVYLFLSHYSHSSFQQVCGLTVNGNVNTRRYLFSSTSLMTSV